MTDEMTVQYYYDYDCGGVVVCTVPTLLYYASKQWNGVDTRQDEYSSDDLFSNGIVLGDSFVVPS
jgi:hypothetical protein